MKVAVAGGTGSLGKPLVGVLAARGDEVLVLSRGAPRSLPEGASHRHVDLADGEGLAEALEGVEAIVGAANTKSQLNAAPVMVEGTKRILRAGAAAGVRHYVGISIVGCDRVPIPYYKVKVAEEEAIAAGEMPWSILRATQFHGLVGWAFEGAGRFRVVPTGSARLQPIDVSVVAERLAEVAHAEPAGRLPDIAGPREETLSELAAAWRRAGHRGLSLRIPAVGRIGRPLREGALCDPDAAAGGPTFEEWLARG
jgi:uncharacterized protein YbjT (DUF2867 family)